MTLALRVLVLAALVSAVAGCADTKDKPSEQNRVSTIPWNRPEKWEGTGALGGFSGTQQ